MLFVIVFLVLLPSLVNVDFGLLVDSIFQSCYFGCIREDCISIQALICISSITANLQLNRQDCFAK